MLIKISNLFNLSSDLEEFKPDYILSMLDPDIETSRIPIFSGCNSVLQLFFYDDDDLSKQNKPFLYNIQQIISYFTTMLIPGGGSRLLIHCHAGASRSTAAAYIFYMLALGERKEAEAFKRMLDITNKPWPSRHMIEVAEKCLGRQGECLRPLDEYRAKNPSRYSAYVRLNRKRNL